MPIVNRVSDLQPETTAKLAALYQERTGVKGPRRANLRSKAEVEPYFDGLELIPPGLAYLPDWRPDPADGELSDEARNTWAVGAIGRKPTLA